MKVRMFVFNNCLNDARVLKEASTLFEDGHEVEIVGVLDKLTSPSEMHGGVHIHRLELNPLHIRLIRSLSNPIQIVRSLLRRGGPASGAGQAESVSWYSKFSAWQRGLRQSHLNKEAIKTSKWYLAPIYLVGLVFYYVFFRALRYIKLAVIYGSRFLIQRPLRFILLPYHKYFVYYDFYKRALHHHKCFPADVVHCHDLNTLKIGTKLKEDTGCKLIYDSHELYLHKNRMVPAGAFKQWLLKRIERKGMKTADKVITVGECIAEWMAEAYNTGKPAVVLNTPAFRVANQETDKDLRLEVGIPKSEALMVYSGSITFNRGIENIIRALNRVEGVHLVLMGFSQPAYKESLVQLINSEKLDHRVSFYGPVPHDQVASYLASADFGIAPILNICLSYYYCSPNKLFEFVQAQLPVLASDFPEMKKVVNDYDIGYTFDPEDIAEIAEKIKSMATDHEARYTFRKNTLRAAERFQWKHEAAKLTEIYRNLAR